jgi:hypothetical protein
MTLDDVSWTRPVIQVNGRQLRDVVAEAWEAVPTANDPPFLFRGGGRILRQRELEGGQTWLEPITSVGLFGVLIRVADWMRASSRGLVPSKPPSAVVAAMRRAPDPRLPRPAPLAER